MPLGYGFIEESSVGTGVIPPNTAVLGGEAPPGYITQQDIIEAQAFRKFIYLWGWVKYRDVFPNTPEHTAHFCWLILILGNPMTFIPNTVSQPPTPRTLDFRYLQHSEGNSAD